MAHLNKVMLIGRLTADPEPARPAGSAQVVTFRFVAGRSKKNPQTGQWENDPNPLYLDCEAWINSDGKGTGAVARDYLRKGSEVYLEGALRYETWEDKANPGQKRSKHKLTVDSLQMLGGKSEGGEQAQQQRQPQRGTQQPQRGGYQPQPASYSDEAEGDIPF